MSLDNRSLGGTGGDDEQRIQESNGDVEMKAAEHRDGDGDDKDDDKDALPGHLRNDTHGNGNNESNGTNPQPNCNLLRVPAMQHIKLKGTAFKKVPGGPPKVKFSMLIDYLLMTISPL